MPYWPYLLLTLGLGLSQVAIASTDFDLQVCMAHSDRASRLECCEEMGIERNKCVGVNEKKTTNEARPTAQDKFIYCKTRDLDGSGEVLHKWNKDTDFEFIAEKNLWEWRSEYSVRSIDSNGGFYETSLIDNGIDRIGECDPAYKWQYEKRLEAIQQKYAN